VVGSTEQLALSADGSFRSTARDYLGAVSSRRRWSVQGSLLTFQIAGYQPLPRQIDVTYSVPNAKRAADRRGRHAARTLPARAVSKTCATAPDAAVSAGIALICATGRAFDGVA
jgi:hypothetical protein